MKNLCSFPTTIFLINIVLSCFGGVNADDDEKSLLTEKETDSVNDLFYKWELEEVRYKDKHKPFKPKHHKGFTLGGGGGIIWSDGCNRMNSEYQIEGNKIFIGPNVWSTGVICRDHEYEDVHYEQVTHYQREGRTLFLHTPSQIYVLEKFPYSRLSMNAWSLYSIIDRKTGEGFDVDRFRKRYRDLLFKIENDTSLRFTDLDGEEFTGSLQVEGNTILNMAFDPESKERLWTKPERLGYLTERLGYLTDGVQEYKQTKDQYPTTYAHSVDWESIDSFRVKNRFLELYSDAYTYKFSPR